jgi:hypothetical protein
VAKSGSGAVLLKDLDKAREILIAARQAVTVPLTIKTRAGWAIGDKQVLDLAKTAEICGVDAIAVHGRVATQGYSGRADWDIIAEVKASVRVPVIANGDVLSPEDAKNVFERTVCDGIMIGRGGLPSTSKRGESCRGRRSPRSLRLPGSMPCCCGRFWARRAPRRRCAGIWFGISRACPARRSCAGGL